MMPDEIETNGMDWPAFMRALQKLGFHAIPGDFAARRDRDDLRVTWMWCGVCQNAHVYVHGDGTICPHERLEPEEALNALTPPQPGEHAWQTT